MLPTKEFRSKETQTKSDEMEKVHTNQNPNKAGVAIVLSGKINF